VTALCSSLRHGEQVAEILPVSGVRGPCSSYQFNGVGKWSTTSALSRQHVNLPHVTTSHQYLIYCRCMAEVFDAWHVALSFGAARHRDTEQSSGVNDPVKS